MSETTGSATIAKLLLLTTRRVQQLASEGTIPRVARGEYDLVASVQAYVGYLQKQLARYNLGQPADKDGNRNRLAKENADAKEMENAKRRGELLEASEVKQQFSEMLAVFRSRCLAIPSATAARVAVEKDPVKCQEIIKEQIHGTLKILSEYGS